MRRNLLKATALAVLLTLWAVVGAVADSTVPALPAATTLTTSTTYVAQGGTTDTKLGFTTSVFDIAASALTLKANGVTNAMLANAATTVNGTSCTLGSSCTVPAAAGTLTGATLASGVTASSLTSVGTLANLTMGGDLALGTNNLTGNFTATGVPILSGLSAGTQVSCLGLDSGNHIVLSAAACGAGAGSTAFSALTGGTNSTAAMVVGTGASLGVSGSGTIAATSVPASGLTGTTLASGVVTSSLTTVGTIGTGTWNSGFGASATKGSAGAFGIVEVDGTTITASGGVITAVGAAASSITPGTTTIVGATAPCLVENSASTTMACPAVTSGNITALGVTTGSAGAPVLFNGAGGTPSSLTLTNATGLVTAGINASQVTYAKIQNGAGDAILRSNNGAAPSEATTGTGVLTALGVNTGTAGAFVVNGGALGTPSSGTATNLTGTAASLTAGTATVANGLKSATTTVVVSSATAPTAGQVLTATSGTAADWETVTGTGTVTSVAAGCGTSTGGSPITTTGTVLAALTNRANTNASDTLVAGDCGNFVQENRATAVAVSIAQAGTTGFAAGFYTTVCNINAGTATITPTTSTIGGASSFVLGAGTAALPACVTLQSDGTNYNLITSGNLLSGGALGTPASGTATNLTGLPVATGISGLGTGVATALAANTNATGGFGTVGTSGTNVGLLNANKTDSGNNSYSGANTFAAVNGGDDVQSGTTYTFVAADCGKTVVFTSNSAITATIPASIVPASGTGCQINVLQAGTAKVSVNGTAVSAATLISARSYTGTSSTQGSMITLHLTTVSAATNAYLAGDGS